MVKELLEGFESAGRSPDADDGEIRSRIDEDAPTRRLWTAQHSPYAADLVRAASGNVVARGEGGE